MFKGNSKLIFILFFASLMFDANTQTRNVNEAFIQSLPQNLQADFINQLDENKEENIYTNPDTRVTKLEASLEDIERNLARIKADLETKEQINNSDLKRFGEDFFTSFQSTFMPINEPNFGSEYLLDVGDELSLQFKGSINSTEKLKVDRNGSVAIPNVDNVLVAGLSLQQAIDKIKHSISLSIIGVEPIISLSQIRDISIIALGNVTNPGMYTLQGGSNILSLINVAGGITERGSYRTILHKRDNKVLQTIDLYKVLVLGDTSFEHQLRSGDAVVVEPALSSIRVSGMVPHQGIFEIKNDESLNDTLFYAGYREKQIKQTVYIRRYSFNKVEYFEVDQDSFSDTKLRDGDSIEIHSISPEFNKTKHVSLTGAVNIPGNYAISENTRLSELIKMAGNYKENAYPFGGVFTRKSVQEKEIQVNQNTYNNLIKYLVASPSFPQILSSPSSDNGIITFLSLLKSHTPTGRVLAEFDINKVSTHPELEIILQDGDKIHIPEFAREVYVFGDVISPGAVRHETSKNIDWYIKKAGGLARTADSSRLIVIDPNGEISLKPKSFFDIGSTNHSIYPGSVIYVPQTVGKIDGINLASSIAPIISSFALSIASLNSINN